MSRAEGFNLNVTDNAASQPFVALAKPSEEATDPAATDHQGRQKAQSPTPGTNPRDTRWPKAWSDDSLPERSGKAGQ